MDLKSLSRAALSSHLQGGGELTSKSLLSSHHQDWCSATRTLNSGCQHVLEGKLAAQAPWVWFQQVPEPNALSRW